MNIYIPITPTHLYIKQHAITKLKYFGKTTRLDPLIYLGSGTHWKRHVNKHGMEITVKLSTHNNTFHQPINLDSMILIK